MSLFSEVHLQWKNGRLTLGHDLPHGYRFFLARARSGDHPEGIPRSLWLLNAILSASPVHQTLVVDLPEGPLTFRARHPDGYRLSSYEFVGHTRDLPAVITAWDPERLRSAFRSTISDLPMRSCEPTQFLGCFLRSTRSRGFATSTWATHRLKETLL